MMLQNLISDENDDKYKTELHDDNNTQYFGQALMGTP